MEQVLMVTIRQPNMASYTRPWDINELSIFLNHLTNKDGLRLTIHAADGTEVRVYPKCSRCGCYNTIKPLIYGLCEDCFRLKA